MTQTLNLTAVPAEIQASAGDAKPPTFEAVAYTGVPMKIEGWKFPTIIDLNGVTWRETRLPVLRDHQIDRIVGHATSIGRDQRGIVVRGMVSGSGEDAKEIIRNARNGFQWQVSLGSSPKGKNSIEHLPEGKTATVNGQLVEGPMSIVRKAVIHELSFTALGADGNTSATIAAKQRKDSMDEGTITLEEVKKIDATIDTLQSHVDKQILAQWKADMLEGRATSEQVLERGIKAMRESTHRDMQAKIDDLELRLLRANRPKSQLASFDGGPAIHSKSGLPDSGLKSIEAAILIRAGHTTTAVEEYGERVCDSLNGLQRASFPDLLATSLRSIGENVPHDRDVMIRAALSNHSISVALGNAANLSIVGPYREAKRTFTAFAARKTANDFKTHTGVRFNDGFALEQVAKGGELHNGTAGESTYTYAVDTFGKTFTIDRKDLINDSVRIFDEVGPAMGRAAARMESDVFYRALFAAGSSYFHSSLGNLATGGGSALDVTSLTTAIKAMRTQRSSSNDDLDIMPAVLLVPPELEYTAKGILESEQLQRLTSSDQLPSGNPLKSVLSLQVDPRLSNTAKFTSGASTTAWYLFGAPQDLPMIYAYLNDRDTPVVEFFGLDSDPKTLAVTWRVYHDFGAALAEYRAAYKAAGA